jgi:hypothetical protein
MFDKMITRIRSLRFGSSALALAVINLLLLGGLLVILIDGTQTESILATAGKAPVDTSIDIQVPALATDLEVIQAQPIFHASRSFFVPADPAALAVQLAPPDYRIAGAMALPKKPVIAFLVHNQSGARIKVQKGDVIESWEVVDVSSQRVALSQNGRLAEIGSAKPMSPMAGMQAATTSVPSNTGQGGLRILSAGSSSGGQTRGVANANSNTLPKAPPGGVGARLYRPPPGQ